MKRTALAALVMFAAAAIISCGGSSSGGGGTDTGTAMPGKADCTAEAGAGVVCGKVVAADGVTPLANAEVRLSDASASLSAKGVADPDKCIADTTGAFACIVPAGITGSTSFIIIYSGYENKTFTATIVDGDTTDAGTQTMAGSAEKKWVVVPGSFDGVQVLLSQLKGCTLTDAGGDPSLARASDECTAKGLLVLDDMDTTSETYVPTFLAGSSLADYDSLFINCDAVPSNWSNPDDLIAAVTAFGNNGGHVYFSDLADPWLTSSFPGAINFGGNATMAGPPTISGDVVDANLAAVVGTPIDLVFDLGAWTVIDTVESMVTTFIQGDVSALSTVVTGVRPITVGWRPTSSSGCVFYTSYHVEGASTGAPQELAIKYLVENVAAVCK